MKLSKIFIILCIVCTSCNTDTSTTVKCRVDSVYKNPVLTIQDQISPTYVYKTNYGNFYSMYNITYKVGDSILTKKQ